MAGSGTTRGPGESPATPAGTVHTVLLAGLIAALALLAGLLVRAHRPPAFGDDLVTARVDGSLVAASDLRLRATRHGIEAYRSPSGHVAWSYRRPGAAPAGLTLLPGDRTAVVAWTDGMLTALEPDDPRVLWHRYVPGLASWAAHRPAGAPYLVPADVAGSILLVLTPSLVMEFRTADGNLRWTTASGPGCAYRPQTALRLDGAVIIQRRCAAHARAAVDGAGTVEAFDAVGRRWQIPADSAPEPYPAALAASAAAAGGIPQPPPPDPEALLIGEPVRTYGPRTQALITLRMPPLAAPAVVDADDGRLLPPCGSRPLAAHLLAPGCAAPPAP